MSTRGRSTARAWAVTAVVAALIAVVVASAEKYGNQWAPFWNTCRDANYYLGVALAIGVSYRIVLMLFDRPRWQDDRRAVHVLGWFTYTAANLLAAAMTSHHYDVVGADASWVSGFRLFLLLGALILTVWWPHPQQFFTDRETAR